MKKIFFGIFGLLTVSHSLLGQVSQSIDPISFAIESYIWTYYELPKTLSDVAVFVKWNLLDKREGRIDTSTEKDTENLIALLRNSESCYINYGDSCIYSSVNEGVYEHLKLYSPFFLLKRYPSIPSELRAYMNDRFSIHLFNDIGLPVYYPFHGRDVMEIQLRKVSTNYSYMVCRVDYEKINPYISLFIKERDGQLVYYDLEIPSSKIKLVKRATGELENNLCEQPCLSLLIASYLSDLSACIDSWFEMYPEAQRIILIGKMYSNPDASFFD